MSRTHPRFAACRILVYHELFHTKVTPYRFRNISFPRSLFFAYSFDLTVQHTRILQTSTRLDQQEITNWTRTPFSRNKYETSVPGKKKKRANAARPSRKNKTATSRTATSREHWRVAYLFLYHAQRMDWNDARCCQIRLLIGSTVLPDILQFTFCKPRRMRDKV